MIYRRGWVPVLWRHELEKRLKDAGVDNVIQVADFLCGRDVHDGDPRGFDYQVVDNIHWMEQRDATFWQRLNRLWFIPLLILTVPFQWLFRGRVGCESTSKLGILCQKITGLK
ncbi:hypothetical protein [Pantoea sp. BAV 3049]|uniref:hypothetical protein n=1 Tax=Pantoea sp. BAV 3049 TaxID=2654188 RepID=UPI00131CEB03|nr:hypothetical protein [Pantoea sp. BAV 3049]